jgi:hydroxymethylpyrimidine/phosphomethylpyrimidine kinase
MKKILLSVAGFDPSSGAGVLLDVKVFDQLGFAGMAILASLTAQNTARVDKVLPLPPEILWQQFQTLRADVAFAGVKIGMLGSSADIPVMGRILRLCRSVPRVVDPVFKSTSGAWFLEKGDIPEFIGEISGNASLLTPNLEEAGLILNEPVKNFADMKEACHKIFQTTRIPCLVKGGHLRGKAIDVLYDGRAFSIYEKRKMKKSVHGTGCFFSSALLSFLARGLSLKKSFFEASAFTFKAMLRARPLGRGRHIFIFPLL